MVAWARRWTFRPATACLRGTSSRCCPCAGSREDIEALGGLVDRRLQILGEEASVLDELLRRLPHLFRVHLPVWVAVRDRRVRVAACFPFLFRGGEWHDGACQVEQQA